MSEFEEKLNSVLSSPEEMEKLTRLAQSFMGGLSATPADEAPRAQTAPASPLPDGADAASLTRMLSALGGSRHSESQELLEAIKPHLKEKRQAKLDRAMQFARMAKLAQAALSVQRDGGEKPQSQEGGHAKL